jgi:hypothetical protein
MAQAVQEQETAQLLAQLKAEKAALERTMEEERAALSQALQAKEQELAKHQHDDIANAGTEQERQGMASMLAQFKAEKEALERTMEEERAALSQALHEKEQELAKHQHKFANTATEQEMNGIIRALEYRLEEQKKGHF